LSASNRPLSAASIGECASLHGAAITLATNEKAGERL